MKKSIIEQFAADAINAPAVVTGGGGCAPKPKSCKSFKPKTCTRKTKKSRKSRKSRCW